MKKITCLILGHKRIGWKGKTSCRRCGVEFGIPGFELEIPLEKVMRRWLITWPAKDLSMWVHRECIASRDGYYEFYNRGKYHPGFRGIRGYYEHVDIITYPIKSVFLEEK